MELFAPRGTNDILPDAVGGWQYLERIVRETCERYGYREIRLPLFEHTEVFARGVGETTDIVEKEMYTFQDRSGRSLTLRPEGTAQVVRAFIEHKLYGKALPFKVYYIGPMFRYERPQKGRYRQFHQFGVEALGSASPLLDVEMIALPISLYRAAGLNEFEVHINSIGCHVCRPAYREKLTAYLSERRQALCPTCRERLERNPLRVLDCKNPGCREATEGAPKSHEHLCTECHDHFSTVRAGLDAVGIRYVLNPRLVRGLDYYSRTVFELIGLDLGAQDALGGGGRYDGLVEQCGGPPTPAVGFAVGMERLLLSLEARDALRSDGRAPQVYVAALGDAARSRALEIALAMRQAGLRTELDYEDRSLKAQMRTAQRSGAQYVVILGDDELAAGRAAVRKMATGEQSEVPLTGIVQWLEGRVNG